MTTAGLFFSRLRNSAAVLAALAVVVLLATLALGSTLASVQRGIAGGSTEMLDAAAPRSAATRVTTHLAENSERQSDAALAMFDRLFPAGTIVVHPARHSLAVDVLDEARTGVTATALFAVDAQLLDGVEITAGDWPAEGVAIQADAADALGLTVGDSFAVGSPAEPVDLTVAALWRAENPAAPRWFADSAVGSGRDGDDLGFVVVDETTFAALPTQLFVDWTLAATHAALDDADRDRVIAGLDRLQESVQGTAGVVDVSAATEGGLAATLERIADAGRGASAIAASAVVIVALLAVIAIVQLCSVLVGSRRRQSDLVRARGLSLAQLTALTLVEAVIVAVPGAALGALAAALLFGGLSVAVLATAVGSVIATAGCLVAVVLFDARRGSRDAVTARSPLPFLLVGVLVAVAAALATTQLYNRGRVAGVDFVAATSPALALVAAALLGTTLLFPVAGRIARRAGRTARPPMVLASRQVAAQVGRYLVPSLAIAIAVSSAVFASALGATSAGTERSVQFSSVGGDVGVGLATDGTSAITAVPSAALDGVDAASSLVVADATLGADRIRIVAMRPESAERVLGTEGADVAAALATTSPDDAGQAIPADATGISAKVEFTGDEIEPVSTFELALWAADADGSLSRVALTSSDEGWTAPLPEGVAPWTVLAVEAVRTGKPDLASKNVAVSDIAGIGAEQGATADAVRLNLGGSPRAIQSLVDPAVPMPVVITSALAARIGLDVGDGITFVFEPTGKQIDAVVSAVAPRLPGVSSSLAIATDLLTLDITTLQAGSAPADANEVWIATDTPGAVAAAVARDATATAIVATRATTSAEPVLDAALAAFWLAAVAAALLALVAAAAFFTDDLRARAGEVSVLRALGFAPREQATARGREQLITLVFALGVGALTGAVATALTVGALIASAVPAAAAFTAVTAALDPVPLVVFCVALAAVALAICLVLLVSVRRDAARPTDGSDA